MQGGGGGGSDVRRHAESAVRAALWCCVLLHAACARAQPEEGSASTNATRPTDSRCGAECVRCAADGCIKCARLLVWPGGECAGACPAGSREGWARDDRLMGRICYPHDYYSEALVGGCGGAALCLLVAACGAAYARCRPRAHAQLPRAPPPHEPARLRDFHKQLDCLRPHAYTLLSILNNTRSQVRELYQLGNNEAAMAYSCVLSDLAKLLILLNKSYVPVVPDEWPRLASWAERVLKRYNRVSVESSQQMSQLVNFLQAPSNSQKSGKDKRQGFSTFKPPSYASSSVGYSEDMFDREFEIQCSWTDKVRPPSYSLIERDSMPLADPWESRPIVRRESIWLEDENFQLTLRPQDELTTEL